MSMKPPVFITCLILGIAPHARAQAVLDTVDEKMSFQSEALGLRADLSSGGCHGVCGGAARAGPAVWG